MRTGFFAALMTLAVTAGLAAQTQPLLQLQGQPYFGGSMKLHLTGTVGQPALLAYGLNPLPLDQPLQTGKGPWYVGSLVNLAAIGTIPSGGRIDLPFTMPPQMPALAGIPIVMQGYVPFALSNPTTLPLDVAYFVPANATILESPNPTNVGLFGDRVRTGDLNGDDAPDVAVGAWFEDAGGVDRSGRVYIFWGPTLSAMTTLEAVSPKPHGEFGLGIDIGDLNSDGIDDLVVGENTGSPPPPGVPAPLHIYLGSRTFPQTPSLTVESIESGVASLLFGRALRLADLNGDGHVDIAASALKGSVNGMQDAGRVEVYWGPTFSTIQTVSSPSPDADDHFGDDLSAADVTSDGVMDLIVANPRETIGGVICIGRVYIFAGPSLVHIKTIDNPLPAGANSLFGNAVVGRDMNGDGGADIVTTDGRNHAYIFWSPSFNAYTLLTRPPDPVSGSAISASFGYFATAGDVNGDGRDDVVVGDSFASDSQGRVFVGLGPYYSDFHVINDKNPAVAEFGWGVRLADLDGDGRVELLAGSDVATAFGVPGAGHVTIFDFNQ